MSLTILPIIVWHYTVQCVAVFIFYKYLCPGFDPGSQDPIGYAHVIE